MLVLDIASGQGTSAIHLAQKFGCHIVGIDYSAKEIHDASIVAEQAGVSHLVSFLQGDAEQLPVDDHLYDAVLCECAFCTFPDKSTATAEMARVLKPGGLVGISDLTCNGDVPADLQGLLAWIACIADAKPIEEYIHYLSKAGFVPSHVEAHDEALSQMVRDVQGKLLGIELLSVLKNTPLPETLDLTQAKAFAKSVASAIADGTFGYALLIGQKQIS